MSCKTFTPKSYVVEDKGGSIAIMEKIDFSAHKLRKPRKQKGIHSYSHQIVKEVCDYFGEKKFGLWLGIASRIGAGELRAKLAYIKGRGIKDPKYLMACCKNK